MLKLITGPTSDPLDVATVKLQLRVDYAQDDALIGGMITSARDYLEQVTDLRFGTQTWEHWFDKFPSTLLYLLDRGYQNIYGARREVLFPNQPTDQGYIQIPIGPLQTVSSIKYYDITNTAATMASGDYYVDDVSQPARIVLADGKSWPNPSPSLRTVNAGVVRFDVGYTDAPGALKQAMMMLIAHWYQNREQVVTGMSQVASVPYGFDELIAPYRAWGVS
jgi:uncharacterized phiE125 gp8 family phage protein